ncbi:Coiled-coil domain-containing protein [Helicobacter pylori]|uniref:Coiled-coil domain-containing protein n=1 Tax=Helicobacter pylori TaxID=210 RepID=UPI000D3BFD4B|nr:Coiled-coil domain-containing protein [Helicobacter pylori]PUB99898.1 Coiled-coil domain-containing protein [Helicobacter pylori]
MAIREKEIELETLKREIAQAEASLENDFAKHMAEKTDEKLEDLFFNNKKAEFLEKHKGENIDFNELVDFYNEELPQKYKREIDKLDGVQFFQSIYDLFNAAQGENMQEGKAYGGDREEERSLPKEVIGNGVSSSANTRNQSVMTRF